MAKVETNCLVLSRRAALHTTAVGGATAIVTCGSIPSLAGVTKRATTKALPLRQNRVKVAAVQMNGAPFRNSRPDAVVDKMIQAVKSIHQQVDRLDLVTFHSGVLPSLEVPGPQMDKLVSCAREFDCYLTCGTHDLRDHDLVSARATSFLLDPSGTIHWVCRSSPNVIATEIGNVAIVPGPMTSETIDKLAAEGAEILISAVPAGFPLGALQAANTYTSAYSIVLAEAQSFSDPSSTATAIFDCNGNFMTRTGSCWTQTVVATLPIAALRANRMA